MPEKFGTSMFFSTECQRIAAMVETYSSQCQSLKNQLEDGVVREEYSTGGRLLRRGYYCPSPIYDIVVGGCNRGRLLERTTPISKPTYRYCFNRSNEMIIADPIHLESSEIIFRQCQTETGIMFSEKVGIKTISECTYQAEKIMSYGWALCTSLGIFEYSKEVYTYSAEGLAVADIYTFSNLCKTLAHEQYHFQHDDEGYLSGYTVANYAGESKLSSVWDGYVFDVTVKRKV